MTTWEKTVGYKGNAIGPRRRVKGKEAFAAMPGYRERNEPRWKQWFPIDPFSMLIGGLIFNWQSIEFVLWFAGLEEPVLCIPMSIPF